MITDINTLNVRSDGCFFPDYGGLGDLFQFRWHSFLAYKHACVDGFGMVLGRIMGQSSLNHSIRIRELHINQLRIIPFLSH